MNLKHLNSDKPRQLDEKEGGYWAGEEQEQTHRVCSAGEAFIFDKLQLLITNGFPGNRVQLNAACPKNRLLNQATVGYTKLFPRAVLTVDRQCQTPQYTVELNLFGLVLSLGRAEACNRCGDLMGV